MGIALKYGSTVEQIKRENKLWTNDSLFLREYLLIPIASENENDLPEDCEIVEVDNTLRSRSSSQKSRSNSQVNGSDNANSTHTPTKQSSEPEETKETSGKDFLSKFDNSFAVLKSNVKKMEQNTSFYEDTHNALPHPPKTSSTSSSSRSRASYDGYQNSGYQLDGSPVLQIKSRTQKVQSSVSSRLEQKSDELFQLWPAFI